MQRILVIDDHALYRDGLRLALARALPEAAVEEAGSLNEALNLAVAPDVVVLDVKLPGLNGVEGMPLLRRAWPQVPVIVLSSQDEPENARAALARGANAFLSKAESAEKIVAVVKTTLSGEAPPTAPAPVSPTADTPSLTARQCEVLELLGRGLTNKAIGRQLDLSENTVRGHVQAILAVLQVTNRSEAAFAARRLGLIH